MSAQTHLFLSSGHCKNYHDRTYLVSTKASLMLYTRHYLKSYSTVVKQWRLVMIFISRTRFILWMHRRLIYVYRVFSVGLFSNNQGYDKTSCWAEPFHVFGHVLMFLIKRKKVAVNELEKFNIRY